MMVRHGLGEETGRGWAISILFIHIGKTKQKKIFFRTKY